MTVTTTVRDALATIPDGGETTITGRITAVEPRTTGQGNPWAVITVSGDGWAATVHVLPVDYPQHRGRLHVGVAVTVAGPVSQYREPVLRATSIQTT